MQKWKDYQIILILAIFYVGLGLAWGLSELQLLQRETKDDNASIQGAEEQMKHYGL